MSLAAFRWLPADAQCWIDMQSAEKRRRTPLMSAAASGRIKCLTALVEEFGADVNAQVGTWCSGVGGGWGWWSGLPWRGWRAAVECDGVEWDGV